MDETTVESIHCCAHSGAFVEILRRPTPKRRSRLTAPSFSSHILGA
ncbi:hypothetical protein AKJ09_06513 [Labilithrix luteola]|uniref:Uncharacterized protein n=1 Tax=Labilithrix luteola TaxID=1391654 RepID=A0A0K1Q3A5_9BACT|nr:hypothetical protein AKJ09_06513 [Labilithrix luteola]